MPIDTAKRRARAAKRAGKKPTTQAGEFIREEMHALKRGSGNVHSRKQAIAIGLSEARRAGVKLPLPARAKRKSKVSRDFGRKVRRAVGRGAGK